MPEVKPTIHRNVRAFVETGEVRPAHRGEWYRQDSKVICQWHCPRLETSFDKYTILRELPDAIAVTGLPPNAEILGVIVEREPQPDWVTRGDFYMNSVGLHYCLDGAIDRRIRHGWYVVDFIPLPAPESDAERVRREAKQEAINEYRRRRFANVSDTRPVPELLGALEAFEAKLREVRS